MIAVDEDLLISAILYIEENINCRVINISSGIKLCERLIEFRNICNRISDKGIFIVSAFDNDGAMSYPAAFDSVIGVENEKVIEDGMPEGNDGYIFQDGKEVYKFATSTLPMAAQKAAEKAIS